MIIGEMERQFYCE